jgi:adenosyl cobinamide kinase/adenosyl cobinamide phosphate guanylyltransferase
MKENDKLIMQKVLVLGCAGSGKSTFAARLHDLSGLPLYHLDNVWWKADRTHISREDFDSKLGELDPELVELVKKYESQNKPVLLDLFKRYPEKQVIVFHSRAEADHWLQSY